MVLALLVRQDQDLSVEAKRLDDAVIAAVSTKPEQRDAAAEGRFRDRRLAPSTGHLERSRCTTADAGSCEPQRHVGRLPDHACADGAYGAHGK